jgi:hypothetical protein
MADVKRPIDAFDYAKEYLKKMPLEQVLLPVLSDVSDMLWMAAPWRWTIGVCEPVSITANTADFVVVNPPADFLYILRAYIWDGEQAIELSPEAALPADVTTKGASNKIAYVADVVPKFRLHPVFGSLNAAKTYKLIVWYKKHSPVLTMSSIYTEGALGIPDEWFWVYREGVMWKAYDYGDDQRAGSAQAGANGQAQFTGKRGSFEASIGWMRNNEPLPTQLQKLQQDPKKAQG